MKLYNHFRNSAGYRARIALNLKGLAYEHVSIPLASDAHRTPAFLRLNPQGLIPALEIDGHVITQSMAMVDYLDRTYPDPPLFPRDPFARAKVMSFALYVASEIHPLNNLRVLRHLRGEVHLDEDGINTWYHHWIREGFSVLEQLIADEPGPFCFGDRPTVADIFLVPQVHNARRFKCDISPYPALIAKADHCLTVDAFARATPEVQPDAA
jgi:maleylacetoacetate isomerase